MMMCQWLGRRRHVTAVQEATLAGAPLRNKFVETALQEARQHSISVAWFMCGFTARPCLELSDFLRSPKMIRVFQMHSRWEL